MARRSIPLALLALLLPAAGALAEPAPAAAVHPVATLESALAAEARATVRAARRIGIHVRDLESGGEVLAVAADEPRILASNTKLLTTAAALASFGPGPLFETRLLARGEVAGGVL
ncbi:MAG TPA: D-alanyl-D-alanine carboxypeptidase, partial [Thermoanaerobaculia bacterium]|nr:D-alanyl-D-alanine carboxypeptidase [Thermoanaerobaculia bacterium]